MAQVRIDFQGRGNVETFSRARVQAMGNDIQLVRRGARQVGPLGQVLTQQPIGIFMGAALPRAVGIGKEHPDRESFRQALVLGHLFPSIIGQNPNQLESEPIRVRSCNRTFPSSFFIIPGLLPIAHSVFCVEGSSSLSRQHSLQTLDDPLCGFAVPFSSSHLGVAPSRTRRRDSEAGS